MYSFSFQYGKRKDGGRRLMGLIAPGRGSGTITTRSFRSGMANVIDQLHDYQQQLPALPSKHFPVNVPDLYANAICGEERYLMCHLFHSPYAHQHHQPPGFRPCVDTSMAVIENGLWYMKQRSFGSVDSGFHRYHALST